MFQSILERRSFEALLHNLKFSFWDLMDVYEVVKTEECLTHDKVNKFLALLFADGYLTFHDQCESDWCIYVKTANEEMHSFLLRMLRFRIY
jgi:hypothetical protein